MSSTSQTGFDLVNNYLHLGDGGEAFRVAITPAFWPALMSGDYREEGVRRIAEDGGWLAASYQVQQDMKHWEMHPAGDEILFMLSGEIDVVLDEPGGERVVNVKAGTACVVPRGIWHRQVVKSPGQQFALTYGKGTQHRPL
jgi:mannose-6-phosphate isomerase-like protein (cupin superfamily)